MRGEIWQLLVEQHRLHHGVGGAADSSREVVDVIDGGQYQDLLKRLTLHQHAILIDLGMFYM
jgi:hypothetical protein